MKKLTALVLILAFAAMIAAGCGASGTNDQTASENTEQSAAEPKTMADLKDKDFMGYSASSSVYCTVYEENGNYYRVVLDLTEDVAQSIFDLEFDDPDHDQKLWDLIEPLEIKIFENLSDQLLSDDDLKQLAGKTGKDLLDDGWDPNGGYMKDPLAVYMDYGPFQYEVSFDGTLDIPEDYTDEEMEEAISTLTVKSVEFLYLSNNAMDAYME